MPVQPQLPAAEKKYCGAKLRGRCRRELQLKQTIHRGGVREPESQGFPELIGKGAPEEQMVACLRSNMTELTGVTIDDVLLQKISPALKPTEHEQPPKELHPRGRVVSPDKIVEGAGGTGGGGGSVNHSCVKFIVICELTDSSIWLFTQDGGVEEGSKHPSLFRCCR